MKTRRTFGLSTAIVIAAMLAAPRVQAQPTLTQLMQKQWKERVSREIRERADAAARQAGRPLTAKELDEIANDVYATSPQLTKQWNSFVERQLTSGMSLNAPYVGPTPSASTSISTSSPAAPPPGAGDPPVSRNLEDLVQVYEKTLDEGNKSTSKAPAAGGLLSSTTTKIGLGAAAVVVTAVALGSGGGDTGPSTPGASTATSPTTTTPTTGGTTTSSVCGANASGCNGKFTGLATVTKTAANLCVGLLGSYDETIMVNFNSSGAGTVTMIDTADFNRPYTGTLTPSGQFSASGTFPFFGAPIPGTLTVTFIDASHATFSETTIYGGQSASACNSVFAGSVAR